MGGLELVNSNIDTVVLYITVAFSCSKFRNKNKRERALTTNIKYMNVYYCI